MAAVPKTRANQGAKMHLECDGHRFELDGGHLVIGRDGVTLLRLPLIPAVEGEKITIGAWKKVGEKHFAAELRGFGAAHLALREGHACHWVETGRPHFPKLRYFPDSHPTETGWHTFLSDELDRHWSLDENADVPLSSSYKDMHVDKEDGAGMTDPGDKPPTWIWNVPARGCGS
jgi:hypothetical protein